MSNRQIDLEAEINRFMAQYEAAEANGKLDLDFAKKALKHAAEVLEKLRSHRCRDWGILIYEKYQLCGQCYGEAKQKRYKEWVRAGCPARNQNSKARKNWRGYTPGDIVIRDYVDAYR
jgi:hypothetical protein